MRRNRERVDEVQSITSAPEPRSQDIARRQKVYLTQMGVRLLAFLVTVATWGRIPMWCSLVLVAAAVVLPYTAVLGANSPSVRRGSTQDVSRPALGAAPGPGHLPGGTP